MPLKSEPAIDHVKSLAKKVARQIQTSYSVRRRPNADLLYVLGIQIERTRNESFKN